MGYLVKQDLWAARGDICGHLRHAIGSARVVTIDIDGQDDPHQTRTHFSGHADSTPAKRTRICVGTCHETDPSKESNLQKSWWDLRQTIGPPALSGVSRARNVAGVSQHIEARWHARDVLWQCNHRSTSTDIENRAAKLVRRLEPQIAKGRPNLPILHRRLRRQGAEG